MEPIIKNISDTARWVAVYRADETDRGDAVFHDVFARKLAGNRGEQIVQAMEAGRKNSWSFIARTYLFDQYITWHVQHDYTLIINLGSGLDTRAYRLNLPPHACWIDIDLPEIVAFMQTQMADQVPLCNYQRVALDLADREKRVECLHQLCSGHQKVLFVSEGLIGYLSEEEAGTLAYDLSHIPVAAHWVNDIMSPGILPLIQQEMGSLLEDAGTPLKFAPTDGEDFFNLFGWRHLESKSKLKTAMELHRLPEELHAFASLPEPANPKGNFTWSGVCLFEKKLI